MKRMRSIGRPKLTRIVSDRLADALFRGDYASGARLPTEHELAKQFGVSRNVVREAVHELRSRGLVETRQGSGTVVSGEFHKPVRVMMADMLTGRGDSEGKLLELREVLEVKIAMLAAERATSSQIGEMEELLSKFESAGSDLQKCAEYDVAFHTAVSRAARNELFGLVITPLNELLLSTRQKALSRSGFRVAAEGHRAILDAIRNHNPSLAAKRMEGHIRRTYRKWKDAGRGKE